MGSVRRYVESTLRGNGFTNISCKAMGNRVEVMTALKGAVSLKMTAAGIGKDGVAFLYPTFAAKVGITLSEVDAELRCLLR